MKRLDYQDTAYGEDVERLLERGGTDEQLEREVAGILAEVRRRGDAALAYYAGVFDRVALQPRQFRVKTADIRKASGQLKPAQRKAIRDACRQVRDFSEQRIPKPWSYTPRKGVILGERFAPLNRVGVYVPGGTAPLVSSVIHTAGLASTAGVDEIVMVTPPAADGTVHPGLLYAADQAGVTEIYRLGGVYAIGALAYGTDTVAKVEKIVGPGNAYVTEAKRQVYGRVALDLVAGPSEIMIIADDGADPVCVAADMLSQAEHGSGKEQAVLATPSADLIDRVEAELVRQTEVRSRRDAIRRVLDNGVYLVRVETLEAAADLAGKYAPEHLEIHTARPGMLAKKVDAAGAIFLGPFTPEPVGDFVAGPSHVLPTGGTARYFSGLTVEDFFRRMSVLNYQKTALMNELPALREIAAMEGLDGHGHSGAVRQDLAVKSAAKPTDG